MKKIEANPLTDEAAADIFQLHDFVAELCNDSLGNMIVTVRLAPHKDLKEADRKKLERRVNKMLQVIRDTDCYLHDVAEFSCR
jgi:hypothetical protein